MQDLWPYLEAVADKLGLRLGAPAASPCGADCVQPDPFRWWDEFFYRWEEPSWGTGRLAAGIRRPAAPAELAVVPPGGFCQGPLSDVTVGGSQRACQ